MIYYFSGTGNSRAVALELGRHLHESVRLITEVKVESEKFSGVGTGLVFPVYSWGVPPLVIDFVKKLPDNFFKEIKCSGKPVWIVMTCGDEVALAPEMIVKALAERGVTPQLVRNVIMPNDYVLLPGFDVDSKVVEEGKLQAAPDKVVEIAKEIIDGATGIDVVRGNFAWIKSKLVYPLFKRWGIFPSKWKATDACVGCGICVKNCPLNNIRMGEDHKPVWSDNCSSCLGCYHSCPRHAVEYGRITRKKGQYYHP